MGKNVPIDAELPPNHRVLSNGAIYDNDRKRIVALRPELASKPTQITSETASDFHARRQERKRAIITAAALSAVENVDALRLYGDDAWLAEIGAAMQRKATNIEDPKMVDAARFLLKETGNADQEAGTVADVLGSVADVLRELASFARAVPPEVVDGTVSDAE